MAISVQTGSNCFLIILQAAKLLTKKESCCYTFQDLWVENLFDLGFDDSVLAEGDREEAMCANASLKKKTLAKKHSNTEDITK